MLNSPESPHSEIDQWGRDLAQAQKWAQTKIPRNKLLDMSVFELAVLMRQAIDSRRIDSDQYPIEVQEIKTRPTKSPTLEEGTQSSKWKYFAGSSVLAAIATGVALAADNDLGKSIAIIPGLYSMTTAFIAGYNTRKQITYKLFK
jgi:hypothetical protein